MKIFLKTVVTLAFALTTAALYGQQKAKVHLDCTCDDPVGSEIAMKLRDAIAASPRYQLTSEDSHKDEKGQETYNWVLSIVSLDPSNGTSSQGVATAMSVVIKMGSGFYWDHSVRYCGSDRVATCADRILAYLDQETHP